jgi:hypothetical protein
MDVPLFTTDPVDKSLTEYVGVPVGAVGTSFLLTYKSIVCDELVLNSIKLLLSY